jgi:hypothetical protein
MSTSTSLSPGDIESLRQEIRALMTEVHLVDLVEDELLALYYVIGGAWARIAAKSVCEVAR